MKNKTLIRTASGALAFKGLKSIGHTIDPYTRTSIGLIATLALSLSNNQVYRSIGVGIGFASLLQLLDIKKGGRITRNNSTRSIFILDEISGVTELLPGKIPDNSIDGITIPGSNGVFKVSDGIYIEIENDYTINYSFGVGKIVNQTVRSGGFKTKQWIDQQSDLRWKDLFSKSV